MWKIRASASLRTSKPASLVASNGQTMPVRSMEPVWGYISAGPSSSNTVGASGSSRSKTRALPSSLRSRIPHYNKLLCYGVADVIHHRFDLGQRDKLWIILDLHRPGRNIHFDLLHALHLANCALNGMLAMLTRNVGGDKDC